MLCEFPDVFYGGFPSAFYHWNEYAEAEQSLVFIGSRSSGEGETSYYVIALNAIFWYVFSFATISVYDKLKKMIYGF